MALWKRWAIPQRGWNFEQVPDEDHGYAISVSVYLWYGMLRLGMRMLQKRRRLKDLTGESFEHRIRKPLGDL